MSDEIAEIEAKDVAAFRKWLHHNHDRAPAVWLIMWKKDSGHPCIGFGDAIDQALCFGWVDSKVQSLDTNRYRQYFSPRKPGSGWSRINKAKIAALEAAGQMTDAGRKTVERARVDGTWTMLDGPEAGIVPEDLAAALDEADVRDVFEALTAGTRKAILTQLVTAKREATRANRIAKTIANLVAGRPDL